MMKAKSKLNPILPIISNVNIIIKLKVPSVVQVAAIENVPNVIRISIT